MKKRKIFFLKQKSASKVILKNLIKINNFKNTKIFASFISINSEISTKFLNDFLLNKDKILCLPVIKKNSKKLFFKEYKHKTKLIPGKFGIMETKKSSKELLPDIILTPCLAYDNDGYRLGYGGGYYDKTFVYLKKLKHKYIGKIQPDIKSINKQLLIKQTKHIFCHLNNLNHCLICPRVDTMPLCFLYTHLRIFVFCCVFVLRCGTAPKGRLHKLLYWGAGRPCIA